MKQANEEIGAKYNTDDPVGVKITYHNGEDGRKSHILFPCDASAGAGSPRSPVKNDVEPSGKTYVIVFPSQHGCLEKKFPPDHPPTHAQTLSMQSLHCRSSCASPALFWVQCPQDPTESAGEHATGQGDHAAVRGVQAGFGVDAHLGCDHAFRSDCSHLLLVSRLTAPLSLTLSAL